MLLVQQEERRVERMMAMWTDYLRLGARRCAGAVCVSTQDGREWRGECQCGEGVVPKGDGLDAGGIVVFALFLVGKGKSSTRGLKAFPTFPPMLVEPLTGLIR